MPMDPTHSPFIQYLSMIRIMVHNTPNLVNVYTPTPDLPSTTLRET